MLYYQPYYPTYMVDERIVQRLLPKESLISLYLHRCWRKGECARGCVCVQGCVCARQCACVCVCVARKKPDYPEDHTNTPYTTTINLNHIALKQEEGFDKGLRGSSLTIRSELKQGLKEFTYHHEGDLNRTRGVDPIVGFDMG